MPVVINPFDAGGYTLAEMTQAINILPNIYTRLGEMGLFRFEGVTQRSVIIEQAEGVLNLLPTVPLGGSEAARRVNADGYRRISFDGQTYLAHVLAWALFYGVSPSCDVDHVNMVRNDNRIANLRLAQRSQNVANSALRSTNTSGYKGVTWNKRAGKWMAGIKVNYRRIHLGLFDSAEAAHAAYLEAAQSHFGEFARAA